MGALAISSTVFAVIAAAFGGVAAGYAAAAAPVECSLGGIHA